MDAFLSSKQPPRGMLLLWCSSSPPLQRPSCKDDRWSDALHCGQTGVLLSWHSLSPPVASCVEKWAHGDLDSTGPTILTDTPAIMTMIQHCLTCPEKVLRKTCLFLFPLNLTRTFMHHCTSDSATCPTSTYSLISPCISIFEARAVNIVMIKKLMISFLPSLSCCKCRTNPQKCRSIRVATSYGYSSSSRECLLPSTIRVQDF